MAVIKAYCDDSQTEAHSWAVGGYAGGFHHWEGFEDLWPKALTTHDVPYFHMREMADPKGVYAKWHPPKEHEPERKAFFSDLTKVIGETYLFGFCSIVRASDLQRFNTEYGLTVEPYPLAAFGCMLILAKEYPDIVSEIIFDHVEKVDSKLATARQYADTDKFHGAIFDKITTLPLPKKLTFRDIPAMQAADFLTWELRKNHKNIEEWFTIEDRPADENARWDHFTKWSMEKHGEPLPPMRGSLVSLAVEREPTALIWDYQNLCSAHHLRGGEWA